MPVAYAPMDFWHVVFARTGSALPKVFPRALGMTTLGVVAATLVHFDMMKIEGEPIDLSQFHSEAGLIVGLLVSFRLNFACALVSALPTTELPPSNPHPPL